MEFNTAFDRLIEHEGGYVNNPHDPGSETRFGISKRSYPGVDIKNLTREGARAIYLKDFWSPLGDAHPAIKFQVFDFAVNSGIQTAIRKLQTAIGVADDGHWGPQSAARLAGIDLNDVLLRFIAERQDFWCSLSTWATFGKGWIRRSSNNLRFAAQDNS
ncbi:MAG: glycosyl hydrolase 108 family protein [Polaromonas sp.]